MKPNPAHSSGPPCAASRSQPVVLLWWRALWLRCPTCGQSPIFRGWFVMYDTCATCGRRFDCDAGYLLRSMPQQYEKKPITRD